MNKEQKDVVAICIESHRRTMQILQDKQFMDGIFESWAAVQRGEKGVRLKDIKRKSKRA